jgi:hypothetical protein
VIGLSTYEIGAFEALEWAWNLLRVRDGVNTDDAAKHIQEMLLTLSNGTPVNFQQRANALRNVPQ